MDCMVVSKDVVTAARTFLLPHEVHQTNGDTCTNKNEAWDVCLDGCNDL